MKPPFRSRSVLTVAATLLLLGAYSTFSAANEKLRRELGHMTAEIRQLQSNLQSLAQPVDSATPALTSSVNAERGATNLPELRQRDLTELLEKILRDPERKPRPLIPQGFGSFGIIFYELIENPRYADAVHTFQQSRNESSRGPWLHRTDMSPDVRQSLVQLLDQKSFADMEFERIMHREGLDPEKDRTEIQRLRINRPDTFFAELSALLGEGAVNQYFNENRKLNLRSVIRPITARLSYSDEPLTHLQMDQILERLIPPPSGPARSNVRDLAGLANLSRSVFTPGQWQTLVELAGDMGTTLEP